jgi:hypothetical protein
MYRWWDGTTTGKTQTWTIGKAAGSLSVNPTSITLNTTSLTGTSAVTRAGNGTITAVSSNIAIATVSVSGTTVTVSHVNQASGTATITVSVAEGTNHLAPTDATISVSAEFVPAQQDLNDMTWPNIRAVSDAGLAQSYWQPGHRKNVTLNNTLVAGENLAGTYAVYILGFNHNATVEGNNRIHFQFGFTALTGGSDIAFTSSNYGSSNQSTGFIMNVQPNSNAGGWSSSFMRNTVCANFLNTLPTDLRNALKTVTKMTDNTGGATNPASNVTSTTDTIFICSGTEVFAAGGAANVNTGEHTTNQQYAYYLAGNSRVKMQSRALASAAFWWLRSPWTGGTDVFCVVFTGGDFSGSNAAIASGFAPCFCV